MDKADPSFPVHRRDAKIAKDIHGKRLFVIRSPSYATGIASLMIPNDLLGELRPFDKLSSVGIAHLTWLRTSFTHPICFQRQNTRLHSIIFFLHLNKVKRQLLDLFEQLHVTILHAQRRPSSFVVHVGNALKVLMPLRVRLYMCEGF